MSRSKTDIHGTVFETPMGWCGLAYGDRGIVRWRIRNGLLVASEGHEGDGYLEIDVRRLPSDTPGRAKVHVEVEIASFYPAIALRIARWFYAQTQSRIHVLVTRG